jgi:hypothetical protein
VPGAARNANQISSFDLDSDDRTSLRVNMKQSVPRDYESHFVFVMPVLAIELRQHLFQPGSLRTDINYVCSYIATARF